MGAVTYTEEFSSKAPAGSLFKALVIDADTLLPKLLPQFIKSIELVQGNGGPGSIRQFTFAEGAEIKSLKHRVDEFDKEKLIFKYTAFEGDALLDKIESISYDIQIEPTEDGGSKGKTVSKYNPKAGVEIKEEDIKVGKEKAQGLFKAVEAYVLSNPDV